MQLSGGAPRSSCDRRRPADRADLDRQPLTGPAVGRRPALIPSPATPNYAGTSGQKAAGEGFEPSKDETALNGFRDSPGPVSMTGKLAAVAALPLARGCDSPGASLCHCCFAW